MTRFLNQDFLLDTAEARRLYHDVAKDLPIVDYHNHLPPAEIAGDQHWDELGSLWLGHDHYKWRVMRWAGVVRSHVSSFDAASLQAWSIRPGAVGRSVE